MKYVIELKILQEKSLTEVPHDDKQMTTKIKCNKD